jgi:hypothetical protein
MGEAEMEAEGKGSEERDAAYARAKQVKEMHEAELLAKANVVGVGIGLRLCGGESTGEVALVVMVTHKVPRAQLTAEDVIPRQIEEVPVDVQAVGELRALN